MLLIFSKPVAITTRRQGGVNGSALNVGLLTPSSGTIWNVGISEAGSSADVLASLFTTSAVSTAVTSALDTLSNAYTTLATTTEAGTSVDTTNFTANTTPVAITEAGASSDTPTTSYVATSAQTEAGTSSDAPASTYVAAVVQTEAGTSSDTPSGTNATSSTQTEAGTSLDTTNFATASTSATTETGAASDAVAFAPTTTPVSVKETGGNDPYFGNVALLLHGDTMPFTDSSLLRSSVTVVGSTTTRNGQLVNSAPSDIVMQFNGSTDSLTIGNPSLLNLGTGDWTIEFFARLSGVSGVRTILSKGGSGYPQYMISVDASTGKVTGYFGTEGSGSAVGVSLISTYVIDIATFTHVAFSKVGTTIGCWVGARPSGSVTAPTIVGGTGPLTIGTQSGSPANLPFYGWLDEVRITVGVGRYVDQLYWIGVPTGPFSDGALEAADSATGLPTMYMVEAGTSANTAGVTAAMNAAQAESGATLDLSSSSWSTVVSETEAGSAVDAVNFTASTTPVAITEPGTLIDLPASSWVTVASDTEACAALDVPASTYTTSSTTTEVGASVDTTNFGASTTAASTTETGAASDTPNATALFITTLTEVGSALESLVATGVLTASDTETGAAADTPASTMVAVVSDTEAGAAAVTHDATQLANGTVAITETGSANSSQATAFVATGSVLEAGASVDVPTSTAILVATISNAGTALDTSTQGGGLSVAVTETGASNSTQTFTYIVNGDSTAVGSALDVPSVSVVFVVAAAESGVIADSTNGGSYLTVATGEALAAIESVLADVLGLAVTGVERMHLLMEVAKVFASTDDAMLHVYIDDPKQVVSQIINKYVVL